MRILHVIASLAPRYGGPSEVLPPMCRALAARGHDVEIYTTTRDGQGHISAAVGAAVDHEGVSTTFYRAHWPRSYVASFGLGRGLIQHVREFDVVHVHNLYLFHTLVATRACRRYGIPYVLQLHGTLNPYHRTHHRLRKAIYETSIERRTLDHAAAILYTSDSEQLNARAAGVKVDGFVIPLGVDPPNPRRDLPVPGQMVLFLGRLTEKKGLDILVPAFAEVALACRHAHLVIAGPDDEGIGAKVHQAVQALGLEGRVTIVGHVAGEQKAALFSRASVFVLPSRDESFGVAVAEAMAAGIPVVVSDGVAVADQITRVGAGKVIPLNAPAIAGAIVAVLTDPALAERAGRAGRDFAASEFSWQRTAERLESMYEAVVGGARRSVPALNGSATQRAEL